MGSNAQSFSKSFSSIKSTKSSLFYAFDPGTGGSPTISPTIKRTLSDNGSHQSIVTQGGTRHELTESTLSDIEEYTRAFITSLQDYLRYFFLEANLVQNLPRFLATRSKSIEITIDRLLDISDPENKDVARFSAKDPLKIINIIESFTSSGFPTYATLVEGLGFADLAPYASNACDLPACALKEAGFYRNEILKAWSLTVKNGAMVRPSVFSKGGVWPEMQKGEAALLCHRPACKRPHLPLEVMHIAFYEFLKKAEPDGNKLAELADFHVAVELLCKHLTDPLESETHRASLILQELKKLFPENAQFRWRMEKHIEKGRIDLVYQRILTSEYHSRFPQQSTVDYVTNLIIIEVKLEEGSNGDAFLQVCRYYGNIVEENPRYRETGAPMFLMTISGVCT